MDFGDYHGVTNRVDPEIGYPHEFKLICNCNIPACVKKYDDGAVFQIKQYLIDTNPTFY